MLTKAPHVACYWVCKHYKNGGIGVQDCMIWNKRIAGKFVWHFAQKHDLLWIKGIHSVYLREEDWSEYEVPTSASWVWRCLCKVRNVFRNAYSNNDCLDGNKHYYIKEGYHWIKGNWSKCTGIIGSRILQIFLTFLQTLGKLRTRVNLAKAGICQSTVCLLYNAGEDSCQHLFLKCPCYHVVLNSATTL